MRSTEEVDDDGFVLRSQGGRRLLLDRTVLTCCEIKSELFRQSNEVASCITIASGKLGDELFDAGGGMREDLVALKKHSSAPSPPALGHPGEGLKHDQKTLPQSQEVLLRQRLEMSDRPAGRDGLRRGDNGVGVDAVVAVEGSDRSGLTEMLDAERAYTVAGDRPQPGKRRWMSIQHGDDAAMRRQIGEQPFDMRARMHKAAFAHALRGGPAGIEPIGRGDGEQADVAPVLGH